MPRNCSTCLAPFDPVHPSQRFCTTRCRDSKLSRKRRRTIKGSTAARGYGARHQAERKRWAAIVAAGSVICWRCGERITPGAPWDLGHDDHDRTRYQGPEHRSCNRSAGAAKGNRERRTGQRPTSLRW